MMHPKKQMNEDLKSAMKSGDAFRKDTLRLLLSAIKQVEVDTRAAMTEEQVAVLLQTEAKKRRDSITEMRTTGRADLADKEETELKNPETDLPEKLTREQLEVEARKTSAQGGGPPPK